MVKQRWKVKRHEFRVALAERELNMSSLARELGMSRRAIYNVIDGRSREPSVRLVALFFGRQIADLFEPVTGAAEAA